MAREGERGEPRGTELVARSLGLSSTADSIQQGLQQIPDASGPLASGFTVYDTGSYRLADPAFAAVIPPLANVPVSGCSPHGGLLVPEVAQLLGFLRPGALVGSACDGLCDAGAAAETGENQCNPLAEGPVSLTNATVRLAVFGGNARNGLLPGGGFYDYTYLPPNPDFHPTWSVDPVLVLPDGRTVVLSNASQGGFGAPLPLGGGVVRSAANVEDLAVQADTQLVGDLARTRFEITSADTLDGTSLVFYVESDLGDILDDFASYTGGVTTGDLVLFQSETEAGGRRVLLRGEGLAGASLSAFGSGRWPAFGIALEDAGDLSVLSADGSNFQSTTPPLGLGLAIAFSLSGANATVEVDYGVSP